MITTTKSLKQTLTLNRLHSSGAGLHTLLVLTGANCPFAAAAAVTGSTGVSSSVDPFLETPILRPGGLDEGASMSPLLLILMLLLLAVLLLVKADDNGRKPAVDEGASSELFNRLQFTRAHGLC
jgi:hypothetical protein